MSILCIFFWRASAQLYGVSLQNLTEGLHPGVAQHVDADYRRNHGQGWLVRTNADCLRSAWLILLSLAGNKAYVLNRFHTRKKAGFNPNHRCSPSQFWSEQRAWEKWIVSSCHQWAWALPAAGCWTDSDASMLCDFTANVSLNSFQMPTNAV